MPIPWKLWNPARSEPRSSHPPRCRPTNAAQKAKYQRPSSPSGSSRSSRLLPAASKRTSFNRPSRAPAGGPAGWSGL
ncbi:MAG: hypothetical protein COB69_02785, partial [Phycisphaera sp.]